MKLIMESFRNFVNEQTEEGYVVAKALEVAYARTDLPPQRFAQNLLKMDAPTARDELLGYLENPVHRTYLTNLPDKELKAELNYIATGSREPNAAPKPTPEVPTSPAAPVKKKINIPIDQPPPPA